MILHFLIMETCPPQTKPRPLICHKTPVLRGTHFGKRSTKGVSGFLLVGLEEVGGRLSAGGRAPSVLPFFPQTGGCRRSRRSRFIHRPVSGGAPDSVVDVAGGTSVVGFVGCFWNGAGCVCKCSALRGERLVNQRTVCCLSC